jgi:hypothetical protein
LAVLTGVFLFGWYGGDSGIGRALINYFGGDSSESFNLLLERMELPGLMIILSHA